MASETNEEGGPGQIYAKFVDDAEKIMRQFSTPVMSANLLNKMTSQQLWPDTAPAEWSTYHQITNVQRLQLEKMFEIIQSIDENACSGWQPQRIWTSTIVTMGTYGKKSFEYNGKKELAAQLVSNEGIASLKADCALILKLITKLTESPTPK
ncbi:hypothetical protein NEUTE1DRAFT_103682 [Neurospora tetrasperma FGSC 2508]|uniref:Uncharacterized protein n=1 Tax=Neurospora tetrasperma (strain FGSC 2508 / ATCC MYA-4615 / P0657) TaxID=510951 RepID=F8MWV0_NEUT8|nr:uncharacterized protein NEUTE1DRAFT_103682 [Neurospora tetrasperma FGSC 2508]EGO54221.1 hypothetical protein NEUTE1DRAFT_103682 [Neurospora tetrasperma FGSC 2508]